MFQLLVLIDKEKVNNIKKFNKVNTFVFKIKVLKINKLVKQIFKKKKNLIAQIIFDKAIFFYVCLIIKISANFKKQLLDIYIKFVK